MKKQIEKNIKELDALIKKLRKEWETASEFNIKNIDLITAALKDTIQTRKNLQNLLDILNKGLY